MPVGYRSVLRVPPGYRAVAIAESEFSSWVTEKARGHRFSLPLNWIDEPFVLLWEGCEFSRVDVPASRDGSERVRLRLREVNGHGAWTVSVIAADIPSGTGHSSTLVLEAELEGSQDTDAVRLVDPPRIVRSILDRVDIRDSRTLVRGTPALVSLDEVPDLLHEITDPGRSVAVIVAGSPGQDLETAWRTVIGDLTRQSVGIATTAMVSASALGALNASLPERFRVMPGQVRTYAPGVDLSLPQDSIRHRILGPATLARAVRSGRVRGPLPKVHADAIRRRQINLALPADVRRSLDLIERQESELQRGRAIDARLHELDKGAPTVDTAEIPVLQIDGGETALGTVERGALSSFLALVKRWLRPEDAGDPLVAAKSLDRVLERTAQESAVLKEENEALRLKLDKERVQALELQLLLEEVQLEAAIAQDDERRSRYEADLLRNRLRAAHLFAEATVDAEALDLQAPQDMRELVARLTDGDQAHPFIQYVRFTGDPELAYEVDKRDPVGRYASAMWEYVRVLADYARTKKEIGFAGNVHTYLTSDVEGFKVPVQRHASGESETVMNNGQWRQERLLPVPVSVEPAGCAFMFAHFKPTHQDTFAPRMHYLDDVDRSGLCFIGYIGRHLTNKQT